jgi:hypothetical protein
MASAPLRGLSPGDRGLPVLKGRDEARARVVYNRLCQLDAGEAILLGVP